MKKYIFGLLALTAFLVACTPKEDIGNIDKSSIVGKWKVTYQDNQPVLTDNRIVYTFYADGTGTETLAADLENVGEQAWYMQQPIKYTLNGNALYTQWTSSSVVLEWLASISEMTDQQFIVDPSRVLLQTEPLSDMPQTKWQRITDDYQDDIIGLWEGTSCTGITYGDHNHRWLYTPSGQYFYYSKDASDKWVISENSLNEYDVDGDYLACRWKQTAESKEDREFWDISINDKSMNWSALRQDANKQNFDATFTMRRVSPTQSEVEKYLPGKWVAYMCNGEVIPTNERSVHTFDGNGSVYYTISDTTKDMSQWHNQLKLNYSINGSYLVEKGLDNNGNIVQWRSNLAEMDNHNATLYAFSSSRAKTTDDPYQEIWFEKVDADYRQMIICSGDSIWQGINGEGKYGDYHHLWEYMAPDATGLCHYIYYTKNNDNKWDMDDVEPGKYMVDGNWLATSWNESGKIMYEWWDITIKNDTMYWSGIRDDGLNTFTLVKVPKSTVGPFAK